MERVRSSAPGRVCLAGEHLDWMCGGPSITAAIDLRTTVTFTDSAGPELVVTSGPPFDLSRKLHAHQNYSGDPLDHVAAVANILRREQQSLRSGVLRVATSLPVAKGVSSSASVTLAAGAAILEANHITWDRAHAISLAWSAESKELGTGAGGMDFVACAEGGLLVVDPIRTTSETLPSELLGGGLILIDTGVRHSTTTNLKWTSERFRSGAPELLLYEAKTIEIVRTMRDELLNPGGNSLKVGALMNEAHDLLRELVQCSTPQIEEVVTACRRAGAVGAKLLGSGFGGCVVALAPDCAVSSVLREVATLDFEAYEVPLDRVGLTTSSAGNK